MASNSSSLRDTLTQLTDPAAGDEADSASWHATLEAARRVLRFHASEFAPDASSGPSDDARASGGSSGDGSPRLRA